MLVHKLLPDEMPPGRCPQGPLADCCLFLGFPPWQRVRVPRKGTPGPQFRACRCPVKVPFPLNLRTLSDCSSCSSSAGALSSLSMPCGLRPSLRQLALWHLRRPPARAPLPQCRGKCLSNFTQPQQHTRTLTQIRPKAKALVRAMLQTSWKLPAWLSSFALGSITQSACVEPIGCNWQNKSWASRISSPMASMPVFPRYKSKQTQGASSERLRTCLPTNEWAGRQPSQDNSQLGPWTCSPRLGDSLHIWIAFGLSKERFTLSACNHGQVASFFLKSHAPAHAGVAARLGAEQSS